MTFAQTSNQLFSGPCGIGFSSNLHLSSRFLGFKYSRWKIKKWTWILTMPNKRYGWTYLMNQLNNIGNDSQHWSDRGLFLNILGSICIWHSSTVKVSMLIHSPFLQLGAADWLWDIPETYQSVKCLQLSRSLRTKSKELTIRMIQPTIPIYRQVASMTWAYM